MAYWCFSEVFISATFLDKTWKQDLFRISVLSPDSWCAQPSRSWWGGCGRTSCRYECQVGFPHFKTWAAFLQSGFNARCEEYCGCPVLFELIEMAREFLTKRNVPVVRWKQSLRAWWLINWCDTVLFRCIICLFSLQELDEITKTECLHFFHKHCLGRYITNMQVCISLVRQSDVQFTQETYKEQKEELLSQNSNVTVNKFQLSCPVCRENIGAARCNWSKYGHCMCSNVFHQVNLVTTWVTFS